MLRANVTINLGIYVMVRWYRIILRQGLSFLMLSYFLPKAHFSACFKSLYNFLYFPTILVRKDMDVNKLCYVLVVGKDLTCYCSIHIHVINFCDSMWSFWVEANLCRFLWSFVYIYMFWLCWSRGLGITLNCLILPHFCACPKPGPGFPMSYVKVFFLVQGVKMRSDWSLIDNGGIVNHQCLIFLFIINLYLDISITVLSYYKNCQREHNTHENQLLTDG